jgi:L-lactate dehydrogenase complex protein LldG
VNGAREEILRRTRLALGGAAPTAPVERRYRATGTLDRAGRLELLRQRLVDYRARVELAPEAGLSELVESIVGPGRIGVPPGLPREWRPSNAVEDHGLDPFALDVLDGVVTGCTVAIAETGTLVLAGGEHEGRRALTLVPDFHLCVVRPEQVVETVPEAFAALRGLERRPLTFVSGPSATSDIELKRVEGVHGPRTLVVVVRDVEPGRDGS